MEILGVKIDNLAKEELFEKIRFFLSEKKFHQIATVGPEFILEAQKNKDYKNILNSCDLNVADGFGIKCAFWRYGKKLKYRFAGVDLMLEILKIAEIKGLGVFLACRKDGLSNYEDTRKAILKNYPNLTIDGENIDIHSVIASVAKQSRSAIFEIATVFRQDGIPRNDKEMVVFVNFGAPYQEMFINSLKNDIIGLGLGVGGSFDFITGKIKRAPVWVRKIGMEWLWRLIMQPWEQKGKRLKRIWNAVIVFPIKIIFSFEDN